VERRARKRSSWGFLDIYAVNGQTVKGLHSYRFTKFGLSTATLTPVTAIADVARLSLWGAPSLCRHMAMIS